MKIYFLTIPQGSITYTRGPGYVAPKSTGRLVTPARRLQPVNSMIEPKATDETPEHFEGVGDGRHLPPVVQGEPSIYIDISFQHLQHPSQPAHDG